MSNVAKSTPPPETNLTGNADEGMTMPAFSLQPAGPPS
jgi:hypothetical protein